MSGDKQLFIAIHAKTTSHLLKLLFTMVFIFAIQCGEKPETEAPCDFEFDPDLITYKYIDYDPAYSPDGSTIAFIRKDAVRQVWALETIDVADHQQEQLLCGILFSPSWSPDGLHIVLAEKSNLFIYDIQEAKLTQLTFAEFNFDPAWSPDGEWISFVRYYNHPDSNARNGAWIIRPDGTDATQLFESQNGIQVSWFNTEQKLIYFEIDSLFTYSLSQQRRELVIKLGIPGSHAKVSADGTEVVFIKHPAGVKPNLWKMDVMGQNATQLTESGGRDPSWSPDGKYVVYTELTNTGRVWRVDLETGKQIQVTRAH